MQLTDQEVTDFQDIIWEHFRSHERTMPWRDDPTPYNVLVSELMLQQTQVPRVLIKYAEFMDQFPTIEALASESLADVLQAWSGLGYNRRAKYLHAAAKQVVATSGDIPNDYAALIALPGIGPNTAAAIVNYAYNQPRAFIETNIRTVYFEHFFHNNDTVNDKELLELVEQTMDQEHPRQWFWALMDYGTYLKKSGRGRLNKSSHYKKQPPLVGSVREVRGKIIRALTTSPLSLTELKAAVIVDERFEPALHALNREGMIEEGEGNWRLTGQTGSP